MQLSIIIVSFNTAHLLKECLTSIQKTLSSESLQYEIIVVDNGSTDGSRAMVVKYFPDVRLIKNSQNAGFGKANNQGIASSKGESILLLNSDTVVRPHAVMRLMAFVQKHPSAFVGGKLLNPDGTPQSSCGPFFTIPVIFSMLFLGGDRLGITRYSPGKIRRVDWISGACIMSRKENFSDGLLFDESIFMYMEEIDLLYRAKKSGRVTYFLPFARIVHYGSASSGSRKEPVINIYKGLIYLYQKHFSTWKLHIVRALLKVKAAAAVVIGTITGNSSMVDTYGKAYEMV